MRVGITCGLFHSVCYLPGSWYEWFFYWNPGILYSVMRLWILPKTSVSAGFIWYCSKISGHITARSPHLLPSTTQEAGGFQGLASYLAFSHYPGGGGSDSPCTPSQPLDVRRFGSHRPVLGVVSFVMFGWSRAVMVSKSFVLLSYPFPGALTRESGLFLKIFLSVLTGISRFLASLAPNLGYKRQKEKPENALLCQSLAPKAINQSAFFFVPFSLLIYNIQLLLGKVGNTCLLYRP